jgi:hypothetical protein
VKADLEASPALFQLRITELEKKNGKLAEDLSDSRLAQKNLSKVVAEKDGYIEELEANNEKNLQRPALEKRRPQEQTSPPDTRSLSDEMILKVAELTQELREPKDSFGIELVNQAEMLRGKFAVEKQRIFEALSGEDGVKLLVEDYERQFTQQKGEFDALAISMSRQRGGKIALLIGQYENRIKALNASHQAELQLTTEKRAFEFKQIKLDIEEKMHKKYLLEKREKDETIRSLESDVEELKVRFADAQDENRLIHALVANFRTLNPQHEMTLRLPEPNPELTTHRKTAPHVTSYNEADDEKLPEVKADLSSLHKWMLDE